MDKWTFNEAIPWIIVGAAGMLGRLMYHSQQVQRGLRKPFGWVLFWDIPIALGTGWIALGVGIEFHIPWEATVSLAIAFGHLGTYGINTTFARWADSRFKEDKKDAD